MSDGKEYDIAKVIVDQILNGRYNGTATMIRESYDLLYSMFREGEDCGYGDGYECGYDAGSKSVRINEEKDPVGLDSVHEF